MFIFYNRFFKVTICLFLLFCFFMNFSIQIYADFVFTPLLVSKVIVTVLAGMGLLTYVQSNGGIDSFIDSFLDYWKNVKGVVNGFELIRDLVISSIINKTKISVQSLIDDLKSFWNDVFTKDITTPIQGLPTLDIADGRISWSFESTGSFLLDSFNYSPDNVGGQYMYPGTYNIIDIGSDYSLVIGLKLSQTSIAKKASPIIFLIYKDSIVSSVFDNYDFGYLSVFNEILGTNYLSANDSFTYRDVDTANYSYDVQFEYNSDTLENQLSMRFVDYNANKKYEATSSNFLDFNNVVGLNLSPNIKDGLDAPPLPIPLSSDVHFPWDLGLEKSIDEQIGSTVDGLLKDSDSVSLDVFIESIVGYKPETAINVPPRLLDFDLEGVVVGGQVVDIPLPDSDISNPDIPTEIPGILGSILSFLKSIFETPDDINIDFSPLQGLSLSDKFPFSLPWDLKNSIQLLISPSTPPRWEVPMVTEKIIIDFSEFEVLAAISRSFFSLIYIVSLIIITRRFIGGS